MKMHDSAPSDPDLLAEWLKHHRECAFHALVARYAGLVHATALRTCGDESLAEEVSQLTFVVLARRADSLASCPTLGGWLHRTALLQAKNVLRQRGREHRKRQALHAAMDPSPSHQSAPSWNDMQPVIDEALAALSDRDREALLLRYYRALSVAEIANTLEIGAEAAKKRVNRATDRLRSKLVSRGCKAGGGALSAILLAGFTADAQAAVPPVAILAAKAVATGTAGGGLLATTTTLLTTTIMKTTSIAVPLAVLLAGGAWVASQRQSIATLERQSTVLRNEIATARTTAAAVATASVLTDPQSSISTSTDSIDWRKIADQIADMFRGGGRDVRVLLSFETQLAAMSAEQLVSGLREIAALELPDFVQEPMEYMVLTPLIEKDPEVALAHFADRLNEESGLSHQLSQAMVRWANADPEAAAAWLDRQVDVGAFATKSLDGQSGSHLKFEGALVAGLLGAGPEAAAGRLRTLSEDQRRKVLTDYIFRSLDEEDQMTFATLVREQLQGEEQTQAIASGVSRWSAHDFSTVTDYLERIEATPAERDACVDLVAKSRLQFLSYNRQVKQDDMEQLREWADAQAPGSAGRVTGKALAILAVHGGSGMSFPEIAAWAIHYHEAGGGDEVLIPLLEHPAARHHHQPLTRELAGMITDETRRNAILDTLK